MEKKGKRKEEKKRQKKKRHRTMTRLTERRRELGSKTREAEIGKGMQGM